VEDIATDARIVGAAWALSHDLVTFAGAPVVAGDRRPRAHAEFKRGTLPRETIGCCCRRSLQAAVAINNARLFAEASAPPRRRDARRPRARASRALDVSIVARLVADGVYAAARAGVRLFLIEAERATWSPRPLGDIGPAAGPS
jgi:hypothetical protein